MASSFSPEFAKTTLWFTQNETEGMGSKRGLTRAHLGQKTKARRSRRGRSPRDGGRRLPVQVRRRGESVKARQRVKEWARELCYLDAKLGTVLISPTLQRFRRLHDGGKLQARRDLKHGETGQLGLPNYARRERRSQGGLPGFLRGSIGRIRQ